MVFVRFLTSRAVQNNAIKWAYFVLNAKIVKSDLAAKAKD